jgi:hypothetical protein
MAEQPTPRSALSKVNEAFPAATWIADLGLESVRDDLAGIGIERASDLCFLEAEDVADVKAAWRRRLILTARDFVARTLREAAALQEWAWEDEQRAQLLAAFRERVEELAGASEEERTTVQGREALDDQFFTSLLHHEHTVFAKRCKMPPPAASHGPQRPHGFGTGFGKGAGASSPNADPEAAARFGRAFGGGGKSAFA